MPTLTPRSALSSNTTQMLSTKNAPAPKMIYMPRPVTAIVLVRISLHRSGKNRLVMMMVSAGRLTISWTMRLL